MGYKLPRHIWETSAGQHEDGEDTVGMGANYYGGEGVRRGSPYDS
jgi:hypothetical protein